MNKKGNLTLFFVFFIFATMLILITSVMAPMGVRVSTKMYAFGEDLMQSSQNDLTDIDNSVVRSRLNETMQDALDNTETNIEVSSGLYQYAWLFILFVVFVGIMLIGRSIAETNRLGGFNGFA